MHARRRTQLQRGGSESSEWLHGELEGEEEERHHLALLHHTGVARMEHVEDPVGVHAHGPAAAGASTFASILLF